MPPLNYPPLAKLSGKTTCYAVFWLFTVVFSPSAVGGDAGDDPLWAETELVAVIDRHLRKRWADEAIEPAAVCSDETFVRRVYLDVVGRIPDADERQRFLDDQRPDKRWLLIDRLLASEDHVQHLADMFDTFLMGRGDGRRYRQRTEHQWRSWLERVFRENRPWDRVAQDVLLARPQSAAEAGAVWFLYERENNHQAIAEAIAPAFFGIKIDCAQCHDHMLAHEIEQQHYWGLVAFYNRSKNENTPRGPRVAESAIGGFSEFADIEGTSSPNLLTFYAAKTIEEARPEKDAKPEDSDDLYIGGAIDGEPRVPKFSRRQQFVEQIVSDHPMIARALVNRVWAMLLGRGLVHPVDQMDSVHFPSHPELLDQLADDFRRSGYNVRRLTRAILRCETYQLESRRPTGIDDPATFAWYIERPLTAEQLARSMQLGLRGKFENHHPLVAALREKIPTVMPETIVTDIGESMFLSNNPAVNRFIHDSQGPEQLLGQLRQGVAPAESAQRLLLALLGREADAEETQMLASFLTPSDSAATAESPITSQRLQYAAWAVITSAEFRFNH